MFLLNPRVCELKGINKNRGQSGHEGHTLRQVVQPDSIIYHDVTTCQYCQKDLTQIASIAQIKRQVFEIPEPKFTVVEHQAVIKQCPCDHLNTVLFPSNITAPLQYGESVESLVVYLSNQQLIPLDCLQQLCKDLSCIPGTRDANFKKAYARA
jgi:transposase